MSRVIGFLLAWLASALLSAAVPVGAAQAADDATILVFGDSISAGYGIRVERGWVNLLAQRIVSAGYGYRVTNASVSGETTAGGLARLPRALALHKPKILLLELGGNDGLRGLPVAMMRENLQQMIGLATRQGVRVLVLGIIVPPNYGERYTSQFQAMYRDLAAAQRVALLPFLLEGVAQKPALMQADGIHPNETGQPLLLDNVWSKLLPLLGSATAHGTHATG